MKDLFEGEPAGRFRLDANTVLEDVLERLSKLEADVKRIDSKKPT